MTLGTPKPGNYDPSLIDRLNQKAAEEEKWKGKDVSTHPFIGRALGVTALPVGQGLGLRLDAFGWSGDTDHYPEPTRVYSSCVLADLGGEQSKAVQRAARMIPSDLSLLILTHFHADHISGIPQLLRRGVKVKNVWIPGVGRELRLALAVDCLARLASAGAPTEDLRDAARLIVSPAAYFGEGTSVREVPPGQPIDPDDPPMEEQRDPPEPSPSEDVDPRGRRPVSEEFEVVVSRDGRSALLQVEKKTWFQFRVLRNGSETKEAEPRLARYVRDLTRIIGISLEELDSAPQKAVQLLTDPKRMKNLARLSRGMRLDPNDTSLVVAAGIFPRVALARLHDVCQHRWRSSILGPPMFPRHRFMHTWPLRQPAGDAIEEVRGSPLWSLLVTGDLGREGLSRLPQVECVALQVPHHGSRNSLSPKFYDSCLFDYGIISRGKPNKHRHPHGEVLRFLNDQGMSVLESTQHVAVGVSHMVWDCW